MSITLVQGPAIEPVTVAEAKQHLRITGSSEDSYVAGLITTARTVIENHTGRSLLTQKWLATLDGFPCGRIIRLERAPLINVESVEYLDLDLATQTFDATNYRQSILSTPGRIILRYSAVWPIVAFEADTVSITYTAGYGDDPESIPPPLIEAFLYFLGHLYANREPVVVGPRAQAIEVPKTLEITLFPYVVYF